MLGRRLTRRLLADGRCGGRQISTVDLFDIDTTTGGVDGLQGPIEVTSLIGDLADQRVAKGLVDRRPDLVFHLAGVVSGEAEQNRAKGYRVNLDGTRLLLDLLAEGPDTPRVVFTSSIAVFGAPFPPIIPDDYHLTPLTSYGTQKAMAEALLADHSRRGLIDGVGIRLPTITVRPGRPNAAASGFFSGIIREPLAGKEATLPVPRTVRHPHAGPRSAIRFLLRAAELDTADLGPRRNLTMPSLSVTVAEQIEALRRVAGDDVVALIKDEPDPTIASIVAGWPQQFDTTRAWDLGFDSEGRYDDIITAHLADGVEERAADAGGGDPGQPWPSHGN